MSVNGVRRGCNYGGQWAFYAVHTRCARRDNRALDSGHQSIGFR